MFKNAQQRLSGKQVLITGATAGIGKSSARIFAESGCDLILTGRRAARLEELKAELDQQHNVKIQTAVFDVSSREACEAFCSEYDLSKVDILLNNAGLSLGLEGVQEADIDDWEVMIDTNIKGLLYLTRHITPFMKDRNAGHVINIGSTAGHEAYAGGSVYSATKYAVRAITHAAKKDLHGTNVRVSLVSPGLTETEFSKVRFKWDEERASKVYQNTKALTPDDVAEIIWFTASRPEHVNIIDTIIYPTVQSSATMVYRDEGLES